MSNDRDKKMAAILLQLLSDASSERLQLDSRQEAIRMLSEDDIDLKFSGETVLMRDLLSSYTVRQEELLVEGYSIRWLEEDFSRSKEEKCYLINLSTRKDYANIILSEDLSIIVAILGLPIQNTTKRDDG